MKYVIFLTLFLTVTAYSHTPEDKEAFRGIYENLSHGQKMEVCSQALGHATGYKEDNHFTVKFGKDSFKNNVYGLICFHGVLELYIFDEDNTKAYVGSTKQSNFVKRFISAAVNNEDHMSDSMEVTHEVQNDSGDKETITIHLSKAVDVSMEQIKQNAADITVFEDSTAMKVEGHIRKKFKVLMNLNQDPLKKGYICKNEAEYNSVCEKVVKAIKEIHSSDHVYSNLQHVHHGRCTNENIKLSDDESNEVIQEQTLECLAKDKSSGTISWLYATKVSATRNSVFVSQKQEIKNEANVTTVMTNYVLPFGYVHIQ